MYISRVLLPFYVVSVLRTKSVDIFGKIRHSLRARDAKDDARGRGASIAAPRHDAAFEKKSFSFQNYSLFEKEKEFEEDARG